MSAYSISEEIVDDEVAVVSVTGYLDFDAAPGLKNSLFDRIEAGSSHLVVDLTDAGFIDSTAIGVLVGTLTQLEKSGGSLVVVSSNENVRSIFELVGLDEVIDLHRSREHAISTLPRAA
jgi:anti-sigma B factor antagonist